MKALVPSFYFSRDGFDLIGGMSAFDAVDGSSTGT
jgi:hypothetical protein